MRRPWLMLVLLTACDGWPESVPRRAPLPPPDGSVAQGARARAAALAAPGPAVDQALLDRGAERFRIFCAPCHGPAGRGDGVVVARGHPPIAPLRGDAVRSMEAMARNLAGAHPMDGRLEPRDRWAVARHVEQLMEARP